MSTPPQNPDAYGDGYSDDLGAPYGQSPYGHGAGFPGAQPPYPYGTPPQYGQAPQYGAQPGYGQAPQYGAMQPYAPNYPVPGYRVSRKEPAISLALSFFLPGLGTIVNGKPGKGIAIMGGYFLGALLSIVLIGIPFMMGFWIWGLVDAYKGAQKHNAQHGFY